jgi:uncharacterized protein (UPF0332 family)
MNIANDLLAQARQLATVDPRKPKQVNLRRAVSSAYYAVFHLLSDAAASLHASDPVWKAWLARTLNHADMKRVSVLFSANKLPKAIQPAAVGYQTPPDLVTVAKMFVEMQQERHAADYDLTTNLGREAVLDLIVRTEEAFVRWENVKRSDDAKLYLSCFSLWKKWDDDPR